MNMNSNDDVSPFLLRFDDTREDRHVMSAGGGFFMARRGGVMMKQGFRSILSCLLSPVIAFSRLVSGYTTLRLLDIYYLGPRQKRLLQQYSESGVDSQGWGDSWGGWGLRYEMDICVAYSYNQKPEQSSETTTTRMIYIKKIPRDLYHDVYYPVDPKLPVIVLPGQPHSGVSKSLVERSERTDTNKILRKDRHAITVLVVLVVVFSKNPISFFCFWLVCCTLFLSVRAFRKWKSYEETINSGVVDKIPLAELLQDETPGGHDDENIEEALKKRFRRLALESMPDRVVNYSDVAMTTKFESSGSVRVWGLAFHAEKSWLCASLHDGMIQLWDYNAEKMLYQWQGHNGPVRSIDFHPNESVLVSGGDDYKISFWNCKDEDSIHLYELRGHLRYVRSVQFHPNAQELPWVLSASDDQTLRLWHYHKHTCLCVLTGHNHYVMCASFHPSSDLLVSASLDQTVRVWDYSKLHEKFKQEDQIRVPPSVCELFGKNGCPVKFVLEGHTRGINWVAFHPTQPLIVSAADDGHVKLWKFEESKAQELRTVGIHAHNVTCCLFHPYHDDEHILSASEDQSIGVWKPDLLSSLRNRRTLPSRLRTQHQCSTGQYINSRASNRFWLLVSHKSGNLLAAAHDSGFVVFQLDVVGKKDKGKQQQQQDKGPKESVEMV